jgi:hypothetical protein
LTRGEEEVLLLVAATDTVAAGEEIEKMGG